MDYLPRPRVEATSDEDRVSQWAVRVGQRLPSRFGQSGAESWAWYKLSWKRRHLRGISQTLTRLNLFMAGAVEAFCETLGNGCPSDRMDESICKL